MLHSVVVVKGKRTRRRRTALSRIERAIANLHAEVREMRAEFVTRDELRAELALLRRELVSREEFHAGLGDLREEMNRGFAEVARGISELALQTATEFSVIRREMASH